MWVCVIAGVSSLKLGRLLPSSNQLTQWLHWLSCSSWRWLHHTPWRKSSQRNRGCWSTSWTVVMPFKRTRWLVLKVFPWVVSPSAAQWGNQEAPVQILVQILRCQQGTIVSIGLTAPSRKNAASVSLQHLPSPPYLNLRVSSGWLHRIVSLPPLAGIPQLAVVWQTSRALKALRSLRQWWVVQLAPTAMPHEWNSTRLAIV